MRHRFSIDISCRLALAAILALLLLGRLAFLFQPLDWICHFPAFYLLAASLFTVVLVVIGRWGSACFGGIVMLACLVVLAGPFTWRRGHSATQPRPNLVVAVANVTINNPLREEIIESLPDADVIALLETGQDWNAILDEVESKWPWQWRDLRPDPFAMTVISRYPVISQDWLTFIPGGFPLLHLVLEVDGINLDLLVVHTMSPQSLHMLDTRNAQFRQLAKIIDGMQSNLVIMGDLNATNWSHSLVQLEQDTGLHTSRSGSGFMGSVLGTWPSSIPSFLRIPIDHCLVRGDVVPVANQVFPIPGSDHAGLVVELAVTPPSGEQPGTDSRGNRKHHPVPMFSRYFHTR